MTDLRSLSSRHNILSRENRTLIRSVDYSLSCSIICTIRQIAMFKPQFRVYIGIMSNTKLQKQQGYHLLQQSWRFIEMRSMHFSH